jgi:DNA-binding NarL/FixJ family response regulator
MATKLSPTQIDEAMLLREEGWTFQRIADKYDVSPKTIQWHSLKLGAEPPKGPNSPRPVPTDPVVYDAGDRTIRRFTQSEDTDLLRMDLEGKSVGEIAKTLRRRRNSVVGRLRTLARYQELRVIQ